MLSSDRKKLYAEFVEGVKRDNAEFDRASAAQKRVIIAQDALKHAAVGLLKPAVCTYGFVHLTPEDCRQEVDLRDALVEQAPTCRACARGGLVFAAILRRDKMKGVMFAGEATIPEFPVAMFEAIECAFEASTINECGYRYETQLERWALATERIHGTDLYRFRRIMQWIIDHKGGFSLGGFLKAEIPQVEERKAFEDE